MEEYIIQIPDTLEIKEIKDGKIILVEKEKKLTYDDIAKELFLDNSGFYINHHGDIISTSAFNDDYIECNNCTSKRQASKLLAINKLMNVAKYLNGDWQLDWNNRYENKYYIRFDYVDNIVGVSSNQFICKDIVYFKSEELAEQAIKILGEETIKLALCTDY